MKIITRKRTYNTIHNIYLILARLFGYPSNPGLEQKLELIDTLRSTPLANHKFSQITKNFVGLDLFKTIKKRTRIIKRHLYKTNTGVGFYIKLFADFRFLSDPISQFIQLTFHKVNFLTNRYTYVSHLKLLNMLFASTLLIIIQILKIYSFICWYPSLYYNYYNLSILNPILKLGKTMDMIFSYVMPNSVFLHFGLLAIGGTVGFGLDLINTLILTMPFLPSEARHIFLTDVEELVIEEQIEMISYELVEHLDEDQDVTEELWPFDDNDLMSSYDEIIPDFLTSRKRFKPKPEAFIDTNLYTDGEILDEKVYKRISLLVFDTFPVLWEKYGIPKIPKN